VRVYWGSSGPCSTSSTSVTASPVAARSRTSPCASSASSCSPPSTARRARQLTHGARRRLSYIWFGQVVFRHAPVERGLGPDADGDRSGEWRTAHPAVVALRYTFARVLGQKTRPCARASLIKSLSSSPSSSPRPVALRHAPPRRRLLPFLLGASPHAVSERSDPVLHRPEPRSGPSPCAGPASTRIRRDLALQAGCSCRLPSFRRAPRGRRTSSPSGAPTTRRHAVRPALSLTLRRSSTWAPGPVACRHRVRRGSLLAAAPWNRAARGGPVGSGEPPFASYRALLGGIAPSQLRYRCRSCWMPAG